MKLHREGFKILFITICFIILLNVVAFLFFPLVGKLVSAAVSLFFLGFTLYFFRLPQFIVKEDEAVVLCPADGKVVVIEEVHEKEYFKDKRLQVSIFMSPINVHVNRTPIAGKVKYTKYHPGDYLVAWHPKSSELNERFTTVIEQIESETEILVRQVAGKLARKISNYMDEGQQVIQGMELGFIKFGSRVDIFFPLNTKICVKLDDKVKGGRTILAQLEK
ncbi:UNVERIFIED_CONTAM: hypothetical protein GTU68_028501 [Idotea baltica]|nr:hypothetical protein [Idotea baltica]